MNEMFDKSSNTRASPSRKDEAYRTYRVVNTSPQHSHSTALNHDRKVSSLPPSIPPKVLIYLSLLMLLDVTVAEVSDDLQVTFAYFHIYFASLFSTDACLHP